MIKWYWLPIVAFLSFFFGWAACALCRAAARGDENEREIEDFHLRPSKLR